LPEYEIKTLITGYQFYNMLHGEVTQPLTTKTDTVRRNSSKNPLVGPRHKVWSSERSKIDMMKPKMEHWKVEKYGWDSQEGYV